MSCCINENIKNPNRRADILSSQMDFQLTFANSELIILLEPIDSQDKEKDSSSLYPLFFKSRILSKR
ncbi:hypothetical protein ACQPU1_06085 [Clostridium paraputrificum]|uniref:hypothetical protein n=1 Tax=Clostridium TaxID=1485 RepID=UPI003D343E2F